MENEDPIILDLARALEPQWWDIWDKRPSSDEAQMRCRLSVMQAKTAARTLLSHETADLKELAIKLKVSS
jgi:hypothetical protein